LQILWQGDEVANTARTLQDKMMEWNEKYNFKIVKSKKAWEEFTPNENAKQHGTTRVEPTELAFAVKKNEAQEITKDMLDAIEMYIAVDILQLSDKPIDMVPDLRFTGKLIYTTAEALREAFKKEFFEPYFKDIKNVVMVDRVEWEMNVNEEWQSFYRRIGFGVLHNGR